MHSTRAATIWSAALILVTFDVQAQQSPTSPDAANAARSSAQQQQLIEQQREAQQRERTVNAPGVRTAAPSTAGWPDLPAEKLCFRIGAFALDVPDTLPQAVRTRGASGLPLDPFAFAREWLDHYRGQCIGKQGVEQIVKGVQQLILSKGYVTTRVLVPEQDLSAGTLKLSLVPGIIRQLRFADAAARGTWKSAFPARGGDLLNLRDLEQGLEQMKRVSSQDVDMQIDPTEVPGESDVVINVKRSKAWTVVASVDNSGTRATGKLQGNLSLGIDNPLGLNDLFNIGASQDLEFGDKRLGSHGFNSFYSVPWGYWTATLSGNANTYYQQIAGVNQTFISSGNAQSLGMKLQRVLSRSQNDVFGVEFQLTKRWGASFIDDTEIPQQRRDNTFIEAGVTDRHYFGAAQFDGTLAYRQGIGWLGATPDTSGNGAPTYRFHMAVLDANLSVPFAVAGQNLRYVTTVHGQFTNDTLFYIDDLTIGSRYTVRGFDGETMLAAERGFYWRNELQVPIAQTGHCAYAGIDYGRAYGPNTAFLAGTQLAGAVIGLRGGVRTRFGAYSYEVFAGTPIYKPASFETAHVTVGFQLMTQF
ncbi:ShlB/FhaC/HecB family hemolysin secretion/activation protein [Trinickia caryophylli]|uniref:Hemolysin activation/secretion protein n=1 Tax=Trinickia caryophylli TaxID=28094 RepID=A0A1X7FJ43_TRICW|nr:ShlB/FhaC/HecB family hemolysin secretion/activation protein [Trinickia caryophylli]PMS13203.1 ShlB/FhaC/HecB family hemolysin secretion/activation protein [Trinickia caryophylli]TRX19271.1 ShlB/FhaC/HecB family hemolysin secretion/activation protein [Trinickia caryophylli]WQE13425.1 ShlB/FhaC/HecB family hemolysin secretion/activation protein [Trinickia caryophylli]SMF53042.1 hemolysin activation/secretion protein [Trinickia caryophylli]GLU34051.1 activator/secretion protein [Trinickia car